MAEKEYIERGAALQPVFDACAECMDACEEFDGIYADCNQCMLEGVKLKLRDLPTADVRPVVRGAWREVMVVGGFAESWESTCSICGKRYRDIGKPHFCPNCGADMREKS